MSMSSSEYVVLLLPALILSIAALASLLVEAFFPDTFLGKPTRVGAQILALLGFGCAAIASALEWSHYAPGGVQNISRGWPMDNAGMLTLDPYTAFLTIVFCLGGILTVLLSSRMLERAGSGGGEYYALLLFATTGAYLMAAAQHLIIVFLGLEILSVAVYPLAGFLRRDRRSNEASIKYFLLGAFSSAILLYGIALIYGSTGLHFQNLGGARHLSGLLALDTLRFDIITSYAANATDSYSPVFWAGIALLLVGFCFKSALAPFHMWTPDVYDGSPTPVTAYMSAVVKAAAFAPFFRFFLQVLGRTHTGIGEGGAYRHWLMIVAAIAILTMTWGNLAAVAEPSLKRMLAYSSVAHAGYITVALIANSTDALLYYTLVYTLMVIGSFGCTAILRRRTGEEAVRISEWAGVGLRYPWLGAAMAVFMFALAGFPPTAGFMGKLYIFRAALDTGLASGHEEGYVALVVVALINSLISVYYYLRVVITLYRPSTEDASEYTTDRHGLAQIAIAICVAGVLIFGLFPQLIFGMLGRG